jgi:hypothetical protein
MPARALKELEISDVADILEKKNGALLSSPVA